MDTMFLLAAVFTGIYGFSFCVWLGKEGNRLGAIGVFVLTFVSIALPIYRIISAG